MNYSERPYEALWLTMISFAKKTLPLCDLMHRSYSQL